MERMLRRLDSFRARGSDGNTYAVYGYEHMARVELTNDPYAHWESTGKVEYKLADGRPVEFDEDGAMHVGRIDLEPARA